MRGGGIARESAGTLIVAEGALVPSKTARTCTVRKGGGARLRSVSSTAPTRFAAKAAVARFERCGVVDVTPESQAAYWRCLGVPRGAQG